LPLTTSPHRDHIEAFAADHADYPREKFVDIIRKTWKKMSERGHAAAMSLDARFDIGFPSLSTKRLQSM
jgi:hypothetical protein